VNIIGIIPARMASSRFPGKPLARISGIPMIGHVYFRSKMSKLLNDVYIATCDDEIRQYSDSIGAEAIMTSDKHERASDRVAEAMLDVEKRLNRKMDIVVVLQGDEPMLFPEMIDSAIKVLLEDKNILIANLMSEIEKGQEKDPNTVKVVVDKNNFALYFSREPIPSKEKAGKPVVWHKQISLNPFRRDFLIDFNKLSPTPLETIESIDMLRVLGHGYRVKMVKTDLYTHSVDTPQDLKSVENLIQQDPLIETYRKGAKDGK